MRMTASYRKASGCIQRRNRQQEGKRNFGTSARRNSQKTIRGSGSPPSPHGFCTGKKNGLLLLRSLAFDAYSCIMVRIQRIHRISGCGGRFFTTIVNLKAGSTSCRCVVLKSSDRPPPPDSWGSIGVGRSPPNRQYEWHEKRKHHELALDFKRPI